MKKINRTLAAIALMAVVSSASAQTTTFSTTSKIDFSRVTEKTQTIRMSRQFYAGYNTICLPFSVASDDMKALMGDGVILERLVQAEEGVLTFLDVTDEGIDAGMPYLIFSPKKQYITFTTQQTNLVSEPKNVNVGMAMMSGKYEPTQDWNTFGIPAQQNTEVLDAILVRTAGDKTFYPTRCGINYSGSDVPVIKHVREFDETTAINALKTANVKVDIYNAAGSLVKRNVGMADAARTLKSGVYVVNGMKFMVK